MRARLDLDRPTLARNRGGRVGHYAMYIICPSLRLPYRLSNQAQNRIVISRSFCQNGSKKGTGLETVDEAPKDSTATERKSHIDY